MMYQLALENSVSFVNGVDKLCYVALFNNMSHLCKTLDGYHSKEAYIFDTLLLKAIFWWRDSNISSSNAISTSTAIATSSVSGNNLAGNANFTSTSVVVSNANTSTNYDDDDEEIIEAFLDNVFYLIGVAEDAVPAAAA